MQSGERGQGRRVGKKAPGERQGSMPLLASNPGRQSAAISTAHRLSGIPVAAKACLETLTSSSALSAPCVLTCSTARFCCINEGTTGGSVVKLPDSSDRVEHDVKL